MGIIKFIKHSLLSLLVIVVVHPMVYSSNQNDGEKKVDLYGILFYQPNGLDGSPYLLKEWTSGSVVLFNGQEAVNVRMKFNIISNDLIYYNENFRNLFIADRNTVTSFILNKGRNDSLYFIKYDDEELGYRLKKGDFVQLHYNGKNKLLTKYSADITQANDLTSRDKVHPRNYYFIQTGENPTEIKLNLKSVIKVFPEHKKELKKIAASIKFRNKSITDLIRLIEQFEKME